MNPVERTVDDREEFTRWARARQRHLLHVALLMTDDGPCRGPRPGGADQGGDALGPPARRTPMPTPAR